jgi:hypothetical protein
MKELMRAPEEGLPEREIEGVLPVCRSGLHWNECR